MSTMTAVQSAVRQAKEILGTSLASEMYGKFDVHPRYMQAIQGADIKTEYRKKVIVWVKKLADLFKLSKECVAGTVYYLDRFLSLVRCRPGQLQVAALACMLLANKYIDLGRRHLCRLFERVIPSEHVRSAELMILMKLNWEAHAFTPLGCLNILSTLDAGRRFEEKIWRTAEELIDYAMLNYEFVAYRPSAVAAASIKVACYHHGASSREIERFLDEHDVGYEVRRLTLRPLCIYLYCGSKQDPDRIRQLLKEKFGHEALPDALTSSLRTQLVFAHCVSPQPLGEEPAAAGASKAAGPDRDGSERSAAPSTPPTTRARRLSEHGSYEEEGACSQDSMGSTLSTGACDECCTADAAHRYDHGSSAAASGAGVSSYSASSAPEQQQAKEAPHQGGARLARHPARHLVASSACFSGKALEADGAADCSAITAGSGADTALESRSTAEFSADIHREHAPSGPSKEFVAGGGASEHGASARVGAGEVLVAATCH